MKFRADIAEGPRLSRADFEAKWRHDHSRQPTNARLNLIAVLLSLVTLALSVGLVNVLHGG